MYGAKDSIVQLLADARDNLKNLESAMRSHAATSYRLVRDDDIEAGKAFYRLTDVVPPPIGVATKILGVSEYFRAPLEHLIVNLVAHSAITPKSTRTSFPICVEEKEWNEWARIKGLEPTHMDALRAMQPFEQHFGSNPEQHPLALLQAMSNVSKHSLVLYVHVVSAQGTRHSVENRRPIHWQKFFQAPFENGAVLAELVPSRIPEVVGISYTGPGGTGSMGLMRTMPGDDRRAAEIEFRRIADNGSGPWERVDWDDFFRDLQFEVKVSQTVMFGPGTEKWGKRLEGLPVAETLHGIRRYLDNYVFQKGGLIESLV